MLVIRNGHMYIFDAIDRDGKLQNIEFGVSLRKHAHVIYRFFLSCKN